MSEIIKEKPATKRDQLIDAVYKILVTNDGAYSLKEIQMMLREQLGISATRPTLREVVKYLRSHCDHYGWHIPRIRTRSVKGAKPWFVVHTTKENPTVIEDQHKQYFAEGSYCGWMSRHQQALNSASSSKAMSEHIQSPSYRRMLLEISFEEEMLAKRYERIAELVKEDLAA